jgi:hypothetical protein
MSSQSKSARSDTYSYAAARPMRVRSIGPGGRGIMHEAPETACARQGRQGGRAPKPETATTHGPGHAHACLLPLSSPRPIRPSHARTPRHWRAPWSSALAAGERGKACAAGPRHYQDDHHATKQARGAVRREIFWPAAVRSC